MFDRVQNEIKRRYEEWKNAEHDFKGMRMFSRLIKCGITGDVMHHSPYKTGYGGDGAWGCHKTECESYGKCLWKCVPDLAIQQAVRRALHVSELTDDLVRSQITEIIIPEDGRIAVHRADGKIYEDLFRSYDTVEKQPRNTNCFSKRIRCGCCGN